MIKPTFLNVKISCDSAFRDILIAELSNLGFDSMLESEDGLEAYIAKESFADSHLKQLQDQYTEAHITYSVEELPQKNWNEEWERNYDPIRVGDKILVRASFHEPDPNVEYELEITPKMSFGTGHHSTTYLMLQHQLKIDHNNKKVLDAGCGTAILAVMAEKLGAKEAVAYDIDTWCVENAAENVSLNNSSAVSVLHGDIYTAGIEGEFDIILANINKNVLLKEMENYATHLKQGGVIIFSGFYQTDDLDIITAAKLYGLDLREGDNKNNWSSLIFQKKS